MSTKSIVTCDRCKKEFPNRDEVKAVSAFIGTYSGWEGAFKSFNQDWCHECLEELGLPNSAKQRVSMPAPGPSLEDMIREIVRQEVQS
jgi:hypothetical protein